MPRVKWLHLLTVAACVVLMVVSTVSAAPTITFRALQVGRVETQEAILKEIAKDFEAKTGIQVRVEVMGWDKALDRILTDVATGRLPDVQEIGSSWVPAMQASGGAMDLTGQIDGGDFLPGPWKARGFGGRTFGVPWWSGLYTVAYNKSMFREVGANVPQVWDEIVSVGKKFKQARGTDYAYFGLVSGGSAAIHFMAMFLWQGGSDFLTPDGKQVMFNNREGVDAINFWVNLVAREGIVPRASLEWTALSEMEHAFAAGRIAMMYGSAKSKNVVTGAGFDGADFGISAPFAGPGGRGVHVGAEMVLVSNRTRNKDAAIAWVRYLTSPEAQVKYCNVIGFAPVTTSAYSHPDLAIDGFAVFQESLKYSRAYPVTAEWGKMNTIMLDHLSAIWAAVNNGTWNPDVTQRELDAAARKVSQLLTK